MRKQWRWAGVVAVGLMGAPDLRGSVRAIVGAKPESLSKLEGCIGSLGRDRTNWAEAVGPLRREAPSPVLRRVRVSFAIDVFHQDPQEVEDPRLAEYLLSYPAGLATARGELRERFGEPKALRQDGRPVERYGDFYVLPDAAGDGFQLAWYADEPDFAIPERSAAETAKLTDDLVAIADGGWTRGAIEARFGKLTPNTGSDEDRIERELWSLEFRPTGAEKPERVHISFRRALAGADLIRRLGIEEPRITAGDTHMQSRGVIDLKHRLSLETGYPLPARGGYALDIEVSREGLIETKEEYPASTVWRTDHPQILWLTALAPVKSGE
jgi:hypothetical protein